MEGDGLDPDAITAKLDAAKADKEREWENAKAVAAAFADVHKRFQEAWFDATRRPDGGAGGVVPGHVLTCDLAKGTAEKRAESAKYSYLEVAGRAERFARGKVEARLCPDCGERAVVFCQEAYYDMDRCCLCGYAETVRYIGD